MQTDNQQNVVIAIYRVLLLSDTTAFREITLQSKWNDAATRPARSSLATRMTRSARVSGMVGERNVSEM